MLEIVNRIAMSSGNAKKVLLGEHPQLKKVLNYAYDPYKHFYIKDIMVDGEGEADICQEGFVILNKLSNRILSGHEGLKQTAEYIRYLSYENGEVFKRILNKDMRIGMGAKSINKVWPGHIPEFPVMRAKLYDEKRVEFPCYVSPKLDGIRCIFKNGKCYFRSGKQIEGVDHIADYIRQLGAFGLELDGELLIPNLSFEDSSGQIRSNNPTPDAKFFIFDAPHPSRTLYERLRYITETTPDASIIPVLHKVVDSHDEIMQEYSECRILGYEGLIIKDPGSKYLDSRSYAWMKLKNISSADLPVTGFFEGTGKYEGSLGGIICDFNGVSVKVGGGFSDKDRQLIWNNTDKFVGKTAEVLYQEVTKHKSLRHPRFLHWRFDKHE